MARGLGRAGLALCCGAVLLGTSGFDLLWSHNRNVARGNELLGKGKAKEALAEYDQALRRLPDDPGVRFNRALALAELGQLDEAQKDLVRASESRDAGLKARAHFNLGNALGRQEKWREAVEAFKHALAVDPRYFDAKWNLELAQRKLKEQEEKEKKKQEEEKKKQEEEKKKQEEEKKKQEEEKKQQQGQDGGAEQPKPEQQQDAGASPPQPEKDKKDEEQKQQEQKQREQQQPKPEPGKEKEQPKPEPRTGGDKDQPQPQPQATQREAVDAVLDALEKNEKNLPLERLRMRSRRRPDKDW
jgi:Ca-activated chloride channel family protein